MREDGVHFSSPQTLVTWVRVRQYNGLTLSYVDIYIRITWTYSAVQQKVILIEIVKLLVSHGAKHYDVDIHGESPLHRAAKYDHLDTVQYLLAQGANVDEVDANGQTALHKAADYGHLGVVKYLARRGSRPDKRDEYGFMKKREIFKTIT